MVGSDGNRRCVICKRAWQAMNYVRQREVLGANEFAEASDTSNTTETRGRPGTIDLALDRMHPIPGVEMDCAEIAKIAGVSKQAIDQTLQRALTKLRRDRQVCLYLLGKV